MDRNAWPLFWKGVHRLDNPLPWCVRTIDGNRVDGPDARNTVHTVPSDGILPFH